MPQVRIQLFQVSRIGLVLLSEHFFVFVSAGGRIDHLMPPPLRNQIQRLRIPLPTAPVHKCHLPPLTDLRRAPILHLPLLLPLLLPHLLHNSPIARSSRHRLDLGSVGYWLGKGGGVGLD